MNKSVIHRKNINKYFVEDEMINKSNKKLLSDTHKNASMAIETIYTILDKVNDEELALELTRQLGKFTAIKEKTEEELDIIGEKFSEPLWEKFMLKMGIARQLMTSKSATKIADMMIKGNTKGIVDTTRSMHDNLTAKREYCELAGELVEFEQINIERLKMYL